MTVTKSKGSGVPYTVLGIASVFAGFMFRLAYGLFQFGIGGAVVGVLLIGGGIVVVFIAYLPLVKYKLPKILATIQSDELKLESKITPAELEQLKALLPALEGLLSTNAKSAANSVNSAVEKKP